MTTLTETEKDFKRILKNLELFGSYKPRDSKTGRFIKGKRIPYQSEREFVVYCGSEFKNQFEQAMKNL